MLTTPGGRKVSGEKKSKLCYNIRTPVTVDRFQWPLINNAAFIDKQFINFSSN